MPRMFKQGLCNDAADRVLIFGCSTLSLNSNGKVIFFIPRPLAGCEHSLIPVRPSFSGPLVAQSSGHLIRSMKWGSWLLGHRFNTSRKIRSILINYSSRWIVRICFGGGGAVLPVGGLVVLIHVLGCGWGGMRWLEGAPSQTRDVSTSLLPSNFGALVNRSN